MTEAPFQLGVSRAAKKQQQQQQQAAASNGKHGGPASNGQQKEVLRPIEDAISWSGSSSSSDLLF